MALRSSKQEYIDTILQIGTCENDADRRELLAGLQEDVGDLFDNHETLQTNNQNLDAENKKLQEANMKLFLRVGETADPQTQTQNTTGVEQKQEKRKFEDLFDEKGGLK